jgi:hypothetical protein
MRHLNSLAFLSFFFLLVIVVIQASSSEKDKDRIVGGRPAEPGQFPWHVAIINKDAADNFQGQFCAGSLIAPGYVTFWFLFLFFFFTEWPTSFSGTGSDGWALCSRLW